MARESGRPTVGRPKKQVGGSVYPLRGKAAFGEAYEQTVLAGKMTRADGNDGAQSSPFADMLDSATPASDQTSAHRTAQNDHSDDSRPADQGGP